jgi:hypothetical protein
MLAALRTIFDRSFTSVCARQGIPEDTSFRNALWAEMTADASAPVIPPAPVVSAPLERAESLHIPAVPAAEPASEDEKEDTKLTPLQRLEKQLRTTTEKLDKIRARQGTAKQTAKQKEADPAEMTKLEAKVTELQGKIAKAAEPKPEKKKAEPKPKAEPKKKAEKKAEPAPANPATAGPDDEEETLFAATKTFEVDEVDEEVHEVKLDGKTYSVGETTQRVYLVTDKGDVPVVGDLDLISRVLEKLGGVAHSD